MKRQWMPEPYKLLCKLDMNAERNKIYVKDGDLPNTEIYLKNVSSRSDNYIDDVKIFLKNIDGLYKGSIKGYSKTDIKNFLSTHMISLTPYRGKNQYGENIYRGEDVKVFNKKENIPEDDIFYAIPIFSQENVIGDAKSREKFKEQLDKQAYIGRQWEYMEQNPEAIIWKDDSGVYVYDDVEESNNIMRGISFKMSSMREYKKPYNWLDNFYVDGDFAFINDLTLRNLNLINSENNYNDFSEINNVKNNEVEDKAVINNSRDKIFENFKNCIKSKYGLTYDEKDLVNFHNSVKTNLLTILAGISGTGKSKIATAYADSLGIKNADQFNMVSVRPFWQDDSDLLGFVDTISNTYHPGDSGVVDTLIQAGQKENKGKMYIIVFDEMNLARVEYYFSQFLSVLEKDSADRKLQLYNKNLENRLYNGKQYPAKLSIPENVRFVGTMNIDETTYQMSDKVLDRANVITLKNVKFADRVNNKIEHRNDKNFDEVSYKEYEDSIQQDYSFTDNQLQFFDQLNSCINKQLPTVGIGWRTLNSIEKFVGDIINHHYDYFDKYDAFDYQVAQRILPKIRGTKLMLNTLLDSDSDESIYQILNNNSNISNFSFTRELLDKKKREIEVIGFAN